MRRGPRLLVAFFGIVLALTVMGPLLEARAPVVAHGIHRLFRLSCHQIPDRCLVIGAGRAPVCARCQAIYAGLFLAGLLALAGLPRRPPSPWLIAALALPMALDGTTQLLMLRTSNTPLRLATGLLFGAAMAAFTVPLLREAFADVEALVTPRGSRAASRQSS